MITVGKRWPRSAKGRDYCAHCDYCGVRWRRSKLTRDASGKLACPDDRRGRDHVTLSQANAAGAADWASRRGKAQHDGGSYFQYDPNEETPNRTTLEEI